MEDVEGGRCIRGSNRKLNFREKERGTAWKGLGYGHNHATFYTHYLKRELLITSYSLVRKISKSKLTWQIFMWLGDRLQLVLSRGSEGLQTGRSLYTR